MLETITQRVESQKNIYNLPDEHQAGLSTSKQIAEVERDNTSYELVSQPEQRKNLNLINFNFIDV